MRYHRDHGSTRWRVAAEIVRPQYLALPGAESENATGSQGPRQPGGQRQAQREREPVRPKLRALSQIIDENKPDGLHVVVPDVAARIDAIVTEVAFTGWR